MPDEHDECPEDEEEILVYVEFDGSVGSNALSNEKLELNMIGLDTEHPIMQINGKFYEGNFEDAVGTYMFFEKDENPKVDDPVFDVIPTLRYLAKTRKVLKMNRIFVELKTDMLGDSNEPECIPSMENLERAGIPSKYQEAALKNWEVMRDNRLKALNDYLEKQRIRDEKRSRGIEPDSASDEENPFVIYKPEEKVVESKHPKNVEKASEAETNEINGKEDESSVIDPEPSTSKDSQPWTSPSKNQDPDDSSYLPEINDHTYHMNLPNVKGKHRATIQVTRRAKIRKCGKSTGKRTKKLGEPSLREEIVQNTSELNLSVLENESDMKTVEIETETTDKADPTESLENLETLTISQSAEESRTIDDTLNVTEEVSEVDKQKIEKQQKRAEKMRLLTEKLKKAANERRLKNTGLGKDPV